MNNTQADLKFAVSITNQLKKNRHTGTGVGANASSRADMMQFMGSDALAELVWSPRTGLNIKFAEEKPCFVWEVGPTDMMSENTQNEQHIASLATCHVSCTGSQNRPQNGSGSKNCVEKANVDTNSVKMEKDGCFRDPFLENAQVAIFDNKTAEKHQESCRSANFLTERKRKCSFGQQLILARKRIKNEADGSSFMNWISNTLKGLKNKHNIYDSRVGVCDETSGFVSKHFGFHNVFQSLFTPETIKQFENKSIGSSSLKETVLAEKCSPGSLGYPINDTETVKHISFYERVTQEAPKDTFDIIRKLRLSRTNIIKWMNSRSSVTHNIDGFFLRLRVAKGEEGAGGSKYYVACITGSQGQSIRVKVGNVECLVKSQHISNCDFLEDELTSWWEKTLKSGEIPVVKDLKSKLVERRTLGIM